MNAQETLNLIGDFIGGSTVTKTVSTPPPPASGISTGAIVGIAVGSLALIGLIVTLIVYKNKQGKIA